MHVQPLRSRISDNWFYLIVDGVAGALVDPVDAEVGVEAVRRLDLRDVVIVTTHGHPDHAGGNAAAAAALGCEVLGPGYEEPFGVRYDRTLREPQTLSVGASQWSVRHAPGHTPGHIVLAHEAGDGSIDLVSGDVLFVGGCGNCRFGGDAAQQAETYVRRVATLADATRFYPGHDYAVRNLEFALSVQPDNRAAAEQLARARAHDEGSAPFLTTVGEERTYNPFLRTHDAALQDRVAALTGERVVGDDAAARTFVALRALRDRF